MTQSGPTLCDPKDFTVHEILQARILEWVAFPFSRDLPNSGIEPKSPAEKADSLSAEPQGKPKNTGVGSLSLLCIFLTQELNRCLLHCRWILYQLSYKGSPRWLEEEPKVLAEHLNKKVLIEKQKMWHWNIHKRSKLEKKNFNISPSKMVLL